MTNFVLLHGAFHGGWCWPRVAGPLRAAGHAVITPTQTGLGERALPQRVRQLIYLDSVMLQDGQSPLDRSAPGVADERRRLAGATGGLSVAPPDPTVFGVPPGPDCEWMRRRLTPHPFGTLDSPLRLTHLLGNGLPCTYVACMDPEYVTLAGHRAFARAQPGWDYREIPTGHNPMITAPDLLVALLEELTA